MAGTVKFQLLARNGPFFLTLSLIKPRFHINIGYIC